MTSQLAGLFDLSGRIALVTGSTHGIGRAIAGGLAAAGAHVIVHGRNADVGAAVAAEVGGEFIAGDLSVEGSVAGLAASIAAKHDRLDVLVNNAAMEIEADLSGLTPELLATTMQVNFFAPVQLTRLLVPLLSAAPTPSVINVSSIHDFVPRHSNSAYSSAKAALTMFTKTMAIELGPQGIRVNSLAPGAIETDMNRDALDRLGRDRFAEWIPLGRVGEAAEMVGPALFLASDASSYVSGANLVADGAYSHHLVRYRTDSLSSGD